MLIFQGEHDFCHLQKHKKKQLFGSQNIYLSKNLIKSHEVNPRGVLLLTGCALLFGYRFRPVFLTPDIERRHFSKAGCQQGNSAKVGVFYTLYSKLFTDFSKPGTIGSKKF